MANPNQPRGSDGKYVAVPSDESMGCLKVFAVIVIIVVGTIWYLVRPSYDVTYRVTSLTPGDTITFTDTDDEKHDMIMDSTSWEHKGKFREREYISVSVTHNRDTQSDADPDVMVRCEILVNGKVASFEENTGKGYESSSCYSWAETPEG